MKKTTFFSLLTMLLLFVGSNAWADTYTHEFVTTDIPQNTEETVFNLDGIEWTLAMDGGVVSVFSNDLGTHFGTNNNTCNSVRLATEGIPGTITSITVEASRGKNLVGTMAVTVNGTDYYLSDGTTTALTQENVAYEYTGRASGEIAIVWTKSGGQGAFYIKKITIEYGDGGGVVVARPVITPNGGTYVYGETQEVTITSEGNSIYYTLDGTDPTDESTLYTAPFTVSTDCTVKAIAYDAEGNASSVASAEFKFTKSIATIGELCAAATNIDTPVFVEFNKWIVTGKTDKNVYFTDGVNGILLYQSGHGFEVGDEITGSAQITLTMYNEAPEIKGLTSTTEGVTVTKGEGATPRTDVSIADIESNMQGCLITLEGVTYSGGKFVDDDDNTIVPYKTFITLPELIEDHIYNVTGVVIWFKGTLEIAPRTADEIVLITSQIAPESSWSVEEEVVDINDTPTAVFTTNSDGAVTYESSDEEVATIDEKGVITLVGKGTTTITAFVAETQTYLPDSKSFRLTVTVDGYIDATFTYNDEDIAGQGAPDTGAELTSTRNDVLTLYANKAYAKLDDTHIKIYGSKFETVGEGEDAEKVLTEPSFIQLTVADGYAINKIVLTATGEGYIKEWTDQFGTAAVIDGVTATWEGDLAKVVLTNQATSQARIKTIAVTYIDTNKVDAISLTPASAEGETVIYNLAGQRLSKMQKGINIVGGKKIAVK